MKTEWWESHGFIIHVQALKSLKTTKFIFKSCPNYHSAHWYSLGTVVHRIGHKYFDKLVVIGKCHFLLEMVEEIIMIWFLYVFFREELDWLVVMSFIEGFFSFSNNFLFLFLVMFSCVLDISNVFQWVQKEIVQGILRFRGFSFKAKHN